MLRIRQHRSPFLPDKSHIHHKLLAAGLTPRRAMISIVSVSLLMCVANILMSKCLKINITIIAILDVLVWTLANLWLARIIRARRAAGDKAA